MCPFFCCKFKAPVVVIASDINMPGVNGIELIQRVKSRFPDTICMLVSGANNINELVKKVDPGHIFTTLTKPIDVPVFKKTIIDAIDCYHNTKTGTR
jgi:DNA-binding NtrC family response regulator